MAAGTSDVNEEIEMITLEFPRTGRLTERRGQLEVPERMVLGPQVLEDVQRRPRMETNATVSGPLSDVTGARPKKGGHQEELPRMPEEQNEYAVIQETDGNFEEEIFPYKQLGEDIIAEISVEELDGGEMDVMKCQMQEFNQRLCALEEKNAAWHHYKDAVFFSVLLLVLLGITSLWLWFR